jgi:hypothetical protein
MSKKKTVTKENDDEMYFTWWLDELKQHGFIKWYDREPENIEVLPAYVHQREKHYKTKPNESEDFNLLAAINYTYDFRIVWEKKALYILTEPFAEGESFRFGMPEFVSHYITLMDELELVSYVDVKPHHSAASFGGNLSSFYTFPFIQKYLLKRRGLFVNKAVPKNQGKHGVNNCLFAKTFTPNRFLFTDASQQLRKIPFKKVTITSFYEKRKSIVESLFEDIRKKEEKNNQQDLF